MGATEVVFITGATGFIGSHVVDYTLQAGYRVRLSIQRKEQEQSIRRWLRGPDKNVEFVHIPDLAAPSAFRDVLNGVDYVDIFHLASPLPGKGNDVKKDYVEPAVTGTTAILEQAKQHERINGERLKVDITRKFPDGFAGHGMKYGASKILAQQATRDFVAREKPHFKLITLIQRTFKDLDGMNAQLWQSLQSEEPLVPSAFVHVRDVAQAHVAALRNQDQLQTRTEYTLSAQPFGWDRVTRVVKVEPADQDLQIKWCSGEDMVRDVLNQQLALKQKASL
ncbi:hypothetical protein PRZ48_009261 [Zasmidium cellare]|uniref:NAD(P)-binding domain-containing protein n=1 Tax=Zasmidium cellare TaxID=395010 RepID=A0ABR0EB97_ZASCE|nr:hypothetical protein PRZ48_009261 [Zasmidium cellare]